MLVVVIGIALTGVLAVNVWNRRGWNPGALDAMSQSWIATYRASQPASPN